MDRYPPTSAWGGDCRHAGPGESGTDREQLSDIPACRWGWPGEDHDRGHNGGTVDPSGAASGGAADRAGAAGRPFRLDGAGERAALRCPGGPGGREGALGRGTGGGTHRAAAGRDRSAPADAAGGGGAGDQRGDHARIGYHDGAEPDRKASDGAVGGQRGGIYLSSDQGIVILHQASFTRGGRHDDSPKSTNRGKLSNIAPV